MAKHTVKAKARYQLRGDTASALEAVNPTLKSKEPVLVLNEIGTAVAFKIGDGVTSYTELPLHRFGADQTLDGDSARAVANKAVTAELNRLQYDTSNVTYALNERINFLEEGVVYSNNRADYAHERVDAVEQQLGGIETALDGILAIQNALIGGASV